MMKSKTLFGVLGVVAFALAFTANAAMTFDYAGVLKFGSRNDSVKSLQWALNSVQDAGLPQTGYFGSLTRTAVMNFQTSNGLKADGVVGPATAAAINSKLMLGGSTSTGNLPAGCTSTSGYSTTTGQSCATSSTLPAGCTSTSGYSSTTGAKCDGGSSSTSNGTLSGDAGAVSDYELVSNLSNEEVGEGEEDVQVAGLKIEADEGSDLAITAVKLVFNEGTAGSDFEDYADEVSVWLGNTEVARVDADSFNDDNDWTKTVTLKNAIIKADETGTLYVAVSGISNLDSNDEGDTWDVDYRSIRFVDGQGSSTTEDPTEAPVTFSFDSFASASDVELKVALHDDNPESAAVNVDDTDDTSDVELLKFTLEAEGSDIELKDLPVFLTATGATDVDFIANTLTLDIDGEEFSETVSTSAATATITFDDLDYTIEDGDEVTVIVRADINDLDSNFEAGDTLKAELRSASEVDSIDADDETGEELGAADLTGSALGESMVFYDTGVIVTLVSVDESTVSESTGANNDAGAFTIKYKVEAFDGTVYVSDSANATTATDTAIATATSTVGNLYRVTQAGTATVDDLSASVSYDNTTDAPQSANGNITLDDGESTTITLYVVRTNDDTGDAGIFQAFLGSIGWNTGDSASVYNNYYFNLDDFKTSPLYIN